jgi:glutamate synthase (NADPH/NADH) small chain
MGKPTGFLEYKRQDEGHRPVSERVKDFSEMMLPLSPDQIRLQAARCMDCGVPFCHGCGCPLGNRIPEFNDYVYSNQWEDACKVLHSTNNFPEITGRVCPALCEAACTLGIHDEPVTIRHIEYQVVEKGWEMGWIKPIAAQNRSGKKIAVVGSGPGGLAAAQQLARKGHDVTVFEKEEGLGGLLRYGIPNFKLDKGIIDRRIDQMRREGVDFQTGTNVGVDITGDYLAKRFDAVCVSMGAGVPRDLQVPGRELDGVHFAMDFLSQQNKLICGESLDHSQISAKDKVVVVIGGGDTGSDCVGTSNRHGAKKVFQFEILPQPPVSRPSHTPWPMWPQIMRTSTSQVEGVERKWCVSTKEIIGKGKVEALKCAEVKWDKDDKGNWKMTETKEFEVKADLVLLAMGFLHVDHSGMVKQLELETDARGNITTNNYQTSREGVFACGDTVSGASLVVRAINSGREMAQAVHEYLS